MNDYRCGNCGHAFEASRPRKFCGRDCANKHRAAAATKWATYHCQHCGAEVVTKPRYVGKHRYCSTCRRLVIGERSNATQTAKGLRQAPVSLTCERCGKAFSVLACHLPRRFCCRACFSASRVGSPSPHKPSPGNSFGIGGWRPDLGAYFRSRWEANYARYLREIGAEFIYEPEQFQILTDDGLRHSYTPDFLVDGRLYVEIKGWLRADRSQADVLKVAGRQMTYPLRLIGADAYTSLEAEWAPKIPGWEYRGDDPPPHPERRCPTCGKIVMSIHRLARFCSRACSNARYRKPKQQRICPVCNAVFEIMASESKRIHCSPSCAAVARKGRPNLKLQGHTVSQETRHKISLKKQRHAQRSLAASPPPTRPAASA